MSKNKAVKAEPRSDWEAPRVQVNPSDCPVTKERSSRGSDRRSDRRSRRGDSSKKGKEDLANDLFDCNTNVPNAGGKDKAKIAVLPMPDSSDSKGHAVRRSRRADSSKEDNDDLSRDLFDCKAKVRNAGGKGIGKIPVLPRRGVLHRCLSKFVPRLMPRAATSRAAPLDLRSPKGPAKAIRRVREDGS